MNAPVGRLEVLAWMLAGVLLIAARLMVTGGPMRSNDSYQYLSVANNFVEGRVAQTSLIHFDTERSWGRVPAPLTTFPSGYSLAVSLLCRLGARVELAALIVSALAILSLFLFHQIAEKALGLGGLATRFLMLATLVNAQLVLVASSIATEGLFTAFAFAATVYFLLAILRQDERSQLRAFVTANLLVGLSYWVRYAGLFFFAGSALLVVVLKIRRRDRSWLHAAAGLVVSASIISLGLIRNQQLVGTWKGGNALPVHHGIVGVMGRFVASIHHVFLGEHVPGWFPAEVLAVGGAAAVAVLGVRGLWAMGRAREPGSRVEVVGCLLLFICTYSSAMIYAAMTSPISFGPRLFYPLLPMALMIGACLIASVEPRFRSKVPWLLAVATVGYVAVNLRQEVARPSPAAHQVVERELAGEMSPGVSLRTWMDQNIGADDTVIANRGQAIGYVLKKKTLSLISREYSNQIWDEAAVRGDAERYRARFLIVSTDDQSDNSVLQESPLLASLARGECPQWLTPAAHNHDVMVFRIER